MNYGHSGTPSSYHVTLDLPCHGEHCPLRILEQTHCARCWRPLRTCPLWPGPRLSALPPHPRDRSVTVTQCGHVYHGSCAQELSHCSACHAFISDCRPLYVHERVNNDHHRGREQEQDCPGRGLDQVQTSLNDLKQQVTSLSQELNHLKRQYQAPHGKRRS